MSSLTEFINDLVTIGGPEKEFEYNGKRYFMESHAYEQDPTLVEYVIFECFGDENYIFRCHGKNNAECYEQFETAIIFDGRTIYEAEQDITILFG